MLTEAQKIKKSLAKVGIEINDIYDLVNMNSSYPKAIPILVKLLKEGITDCKLKEGVIRSLAVKEAKGIANKVLIDEFKRVSNDNILLKWTIGNTIEVIAQEEDLNEIIQIIKNSDNGMSRQMFVMALSKFKNKQIEDLLIKLLDDDELVLQSLDALIKIKSSKSINKIKSLLQSSRKPVKDKAEKALRKISK